MPCAICQLRKPRRYCPGVHGEICTICCAAGREETIDCPLDCRYLQDAHEHEKKPDLDQSEIPNRDILVDQEFVERHEVLMSFASIAIFEGATKAPGTTDWDVREALEALIRTYRALQSGIFYEAPVINPLAAPIVDGVQAKFADIRRREIAATGSTTLRDTAILGALVFLQRIEYTHNNGRRRSRAFMDFLGRFYSGDNEPVESGAEGGAPEPDAPRIIL